MFEVFEHTADLGLRIRAADLPALFQESARALFSMIVENYDSICQELPTIQQEFEIEASERDYLLFDWLNELLYQFDTEHLIATRVEIEFPGEYHLKARIGGVLLDESRHQLGHEVKAITYHQFEIQETPTGFQAEFIVDI